MNCHKTILINKQILGQLSASGDRLDSFEHNTMVRCKKSSNGRKLKNLKQKVWTVSVSHRWGTSASQGQGSVSGLNPPQGQAYLKAGSMHSAKSTTGIARPCQ